MNAVLFQEVKNILSLNFVALLDRPVGMAPPPEGRSGRRRQRPQLRWNLCRREFSSEETLKSDVNICFQPVNKVFL